MDKNLELLKQEFSDSKNEGILKYLIPVLEDFEKRIDNNKDSIGLLNENVRKLHNRIRKLEQAKTYFPFTEEELLKEKIGGTH